jgi:BMFP domain-containing protein YqiC
LSELSLDQAVSREEFDRLLDTHNEHRAFIDGRLGEIEEGLAQRISHLEDRLAANGYFADGPRKSHPLIERLSELESRLSFDVMINGLSKKMRRLIATGVFVAVAALAGSGVALAEDVYVNSVMAHNSAARSEQIEAIMHKIEALDARTKHDSDTRDAQIESLMDAIQASDNKIMQALKASH